MAKQKDESRKKGTFGDVRLPVTKEYVFPVSRKQMMMLGGIGCALIALYYAADAVLLNNTFISSGDLSSNHSQFESNCASCHQSFAGVTDSKCSTCHEKANDKLGVYTFSAHYLYRSEDAGRIGTAKKKHASDEQRCANCHPDHKGREAAITRTPDSKCASCHFSSFNKNHPEFAFARTNTPDDSTLKMTHVLHTKEVLKLLKTPNAEQACLYCHEAQPDGKGFKSLDFDAHCGDCHLTANVETSSLAIKDAANPSSIGVETLEMIQRRRGPGTTWAFYTNPNEFTVSGSRVKKSPVYHRDPWVLENLKQLYRIMHSDSTLADLLAASGQGTTRSKEEVYHEAIKTLQEYVIGLRSHPEAEIQRELTMIDSLLKAAQRRISFGDMLPELPGLAQSVKAVTQRQEIDDFAQKLAKPCLECHYVQGASILNVKASQRSFLRAEFDHRAHIIQRRCLDCHNVIPVERAIAGDTTGVAAIDKASTHNIPKLDNCTECHTQSAGLSNCVSCHFMHPNKQNRGSLQLYVERK